MKTMRGVLFFSDQQPAISGYIIINGEHFEVAGWPAETSARKAQKASEQGKQQDLFENDNG